MLLHIRTPRGMRGRITTLGKAQEKALQILAERPGMTPPRKGQVSARGLVRRHTFESMAGSGMARVRRLDDQRLQVDLTPEGERIAAALGYRVRKPRKDVNRKPPAKSVRTRRRQVAEQHASH